MKRNNFLRKLRENAGLSAAELARALKQNPSQISRMERGEIQPPPTLVPKLQLMIGGKLEDYLTAYLEDKKEKWQNKIKKAKKGAKK